MCRTDTAYFLFFTGLFCSFLFINIYLYSAFYNCSLSKSCTSNQSSPICCSLCTSICSFISSSFCFASSMLLLASTMSPNNSSNSVTSSPSPNLSWLFCSRCSNRSKFFQTVLNTLPAAFYRENWICITIFGNSCKGSRNMPIRDHMRFCRSNLTYDDQIVCCRKRNPFAFFGSF